MNWWTYVQEVTNGAAQEKVAQKVGVTGPTVNRWQKSAPKPETVAAFARAYGRPVLEAFVAAGFLTPDEARADVTIARPDDLTNFELVEAIGRRLGVNVGVVGTRSQLAKLTRSHLGAVDNDHDELRAVANEDDTLEQISEDQQQEP